MLKVLTDEVRHGLVAGATGTDADDRNLDSVQFGRDEITHVFRPRRAGRLGGGEGGKGRHSGTDASEFTKKSAARAVAVGRSIVVLVVHLWIC